jgi:enoyl-CoA hydratase
LTGVDGLREIRSDGVLTLVFDRPQARNALTVAMRQRLEVVCALVDEDDDIDVVVLTGADPAFCAGADMKEIAAQGGSLPSTDPGRALRNLRKPVIGAINGPCVTGGLEIALSCDFLVASERAQFADTHAHLGVLPRWGMSALLPRAVGVRWAKELSATRAVIDAEAALRIGLVNHVVPHDQLEARVAAITNAIRLANGATVTATFALYDDGLNLAQTDALQLEAERGAAWVVDLSHFATQDRAPKSG